MNPLQQRTNVIDEKIVKKIVELKEGKKMDKLISRVFEYNKKIQATLDPWDKLKWSEAKSKYLYMRLMKEKGKDGQEA